MNRPKVAALAAVLAFGFAAALLAFPHHANAWNIGALPAGYFAGSYQTVCHVATDPCLGGEGSICNHYSVSAVGVRTFSEADCVNPTFAQDLDAYVNETICTVNPAAGQQIGMCIPTTATTAAEATTTTTSAPPPPPAGGSTTTTVTVTAPAPTTTGPTVEERIAVLEAQYAALAGRVDAISKANGASWDAFIAVIEKGGSVGEAALAARSAGLNAVYEL